MSWNTPRVYNAGAFVGAGKPFAGGSDPPPKLPAAYIPPAAGIPPEGKAGVARRAAEEPADPNAPLAPWPSIDRYPVILGSSVTLQYISNVMRTCLTGYRREYVDVLDELLERDPHTYAVCAQRVHAVTGSAIQVNAAQVDEDDEKLADRAEEIRAYVERTIKRIPDLQRALSQLQWGGLFYGVGCSEVSWAKDADGWYVARLHWIHSRRLNYPDPGSWNLRIWDQGSVASANPLEDPTGQLFGLDPSLFPGKFVVHAPAVRGNYPTRDGLGREVALWSALKLMGARGAAQYIERFGKPWVIGYYATGETADAHRTADDKDVAALQAAGHALGIGSLANASLPDSTKVEMFGPASTSTGRQLLHVQFINAVNAEISKAVLGQTDTTEAGPNGARASTEVRKEGTKELYRYDAACLADSLQSGLVKWIVAVNFPGEEHLAPSILVQVGEEPSLDAILDRAIKAAAAGAPVDADAVCEEAGVPLLPKPDPEEVLAAQLEQDDLDEQNAQAQHDADERANKAAADATGMVHVPKERVKQLKPKRKLPKDQGRRLYPLAQLKPYEANDLINMDQGKPPAAPPKLVPPSAEAGPGGGGLLPPPAPKAPPGAAGALPGASPKPSTTPPAKGAPTPTK